MQVYQIMETRLSDCGKRRGTQLALSDYGNYYQIVGTERHTRLIIYYGL